MHQIHGAGPMFASHCGDCGLMLRLRLIQILQQEIELGGRPSRDSTMPPGDVTDDSATSTERDP